MGLGGDQTGVDQVPCCIDRALGAELACSPPSRHRLVEAVPISSSAMNRRQACCDQPRPRLADRPIKRRNDMRSSKHFIQSDRRTARRAIAAAGCAAIVERRIRRRYRVRPSALLSTASHRPSPGIRVAINLRRSAPADDGWTIRSARPTQPSSRTGDHDAHDCQQFKSKPKGILQSLEDGGGKVSYKDRTHGRAPRKPSGQAPRNLLFAARPRQIYRTSAGR